MSEGAFWPKTWREASPLMVWEIFIFAAGFEGIASLVHGEWVSCFASFAIMLALTAMLLHWKVLLERVNPNWMAGAAITLIIAIAVSPFVRQGEWLPPRGSVGIGILIHPDSACFCRDGYVAVYRAQTPSAAPAAQSQIIAARGIDTQTQLDVVHLLDFAVSEAAFWVLDRLVDLSELSEITDGFEGGAEEAHKSREFFVGYVRQQLGPATFRLSDYLD